MFIIVAGNVADGFTHYGPFIDAESANEWGDHGLDNCGSEWVVVSLERPDGADGVYRALAVSDQLIDEWAEVYADGDEPINGADMVDYVGNMITALTN